MKVQCTAHSHANNAINNAILDIQKSSPHLVWIDIPFSMGSDISQQVSPCSLYSVPELNDALEEIYESVTPDTLCLVITQGDLKCFRTLQAFKQRYS